jgi:hypothetical protein
MIERWDWHFRERLLIQQSLISSVSHSHSCLFTRIIQKQADLSKTSFHWRAPLFLCISDPAISKRSAISQLLTGRWQSLVSIHIWSPWLTNSRYSRRMTNSLTLHRYRSSPRIYTTLIGIGTSKSPIFCAFGCPTPHMKMINPEKKPTWSPWLRIPPGLVTSASCRSCSLLCCNLSHFRLNRMLMAIELLCDEWSNS